MKYIFAFCILIISIFVFTGCQQQTESDSITLKSNTSNNQQTQERKTMNDNLKTLEDFEPITANKATLQTNKGPIVVELYQEKAPLTVTNFATLAQQGFYNGIIFHRVIPEFIVQAGDPLTKQKGMEARWGTGDPGYKFADEFNASLSNTKGTISMANSGPNTNGSQFFINLVDNTGLDFDKEPMTSKHAVFGKIVEGMDTVESIEKGDIIESVTIE